MKISKSILTILAGTALLALPLSMRAEDAEKAGKNDGFIGVVTAYDADAKKLSVNDPKEDKVTIFTLSETTKIVGDDGKEVEVTTIKEGLRVKVLATEEDIAKRVKVTDKQVGEKGEKKNKEG